MMSNSFNLPYHIKSRNLTSAYLANNYSGHIIALHTLGVAKSLRHLGEPLEPDPDYTGAGKRHFLMLHFLQATPFI